jgi:outer membrane protein, multidrug efflux system
VNGDIARVAGLTALTLLGGCKLTPRYEPPHPPLPASYQGTELFGPAQPEAGAALRGDWWTLLGDPELDQLEEALGRANPTLAAAGQAYAQARELVNEARSALYPQLTAEGSISDNKQSAHRLFRLNPSVGTQESSNIVSAAAAWEPDFWRDIRSSVSQHKLLAQASAADLANVRLSLQAELASEYVALRGLDAELLVLSESIATYEKAVEVTRLRANGEIASGLDLARAQSQFASAQAQETETRLQRDLLQHAVAVLVGESPSEFALAPTDEFRLRAPEIPAGIPSELLQRRPDIARSERQMAAANEAIGIARAAFYPHITLTGAAGFEDDAFNLLSLPNSFWSVGSAAVLPLIDGGLRRARLRRSWSEYEQTRDFYRATVLSAFQEVEDGLTLTHRLQAELNQQEQASEQAAQALNISTLLYHDGLDNYLSVSVAQVQALAARTVEVEVRARQVQASVALIRSLGGGWSEADLALSLPAAGQREEGSHLAVSTSY